MTARCILVRIATIVFAFSYRCRRLWLRLKAELYYKFIFKSFGKNSTLWDPLLIMNPKGICIGSNVEILYRVWLAALPCSVFHEASLVIEDGCRIGNLTQIFSTKSITIHRNVIISGKVYIADNQHSYSNPLIPVKHQSIEQKKEVVIGEGSWLGQNVCVIGASIGKNCVIGANSVVTSSIPDYSVAVGAPARVIKQYDFNAKMWRKVGN